MIKEFIRKILCKQNLHFVHGWDEYLAPDTMNPNTNEIVDGDLKHRKCLNCSREEIYYQTVNRGNYWQPIEAGKYFNPKNLHQFFPRKNFQQLRYDQATKS